MSKQVTAVVVCHEVSDYLRQTLSALAIQTRHPDQLILVNTSGSALDAPENAEVLDLNPRSSLHDSLAAATARIEPDPNRFLWILHDDSPPEPSCLEELLAAEEQSSLAGIIGPKQLKIHNPREIFQQGLTLSPGGTPVSLAANELDQSQHDSMTDVMAVGTAGMLIRSDVYQAVGGLGAKVPPLAADYDLCLRAKLAGHRVIVAPKARILHAGLSLKGARPRSWLGGSPKTAVRKAAVHLRFAYSSPLACLLYWMLLPAITVLRVFWRFLQKRPDRIFAELAAGFWGFFTVFARIAARPKAKQSAIRSVRKAFDASWSQVRSINRSRADLEDAEQIKAAFERGEHELEAAQTGKTFTDDRGWFWVVSLLAVSWSFFPTGVAAVGGGSIPLAQNWWEVFTRVGASWQPIGQGFVAPSDPFNWVLLALASLSPSVPSLSIAILLFAAPALAFAAAYKVSTLLTPRTWLRVTVGLGYALWPALISARSEARIATVVALVLLPWFVFTVARAAGLGRSGSARSMRQTWSWVGVSGLLMAAIGSSSPVLLIVLLLGLAAVAFTRLRRFGYLLWVPLPVAALFTPLVWNLGFVMGQPFGLLADPGMPLTDRSGRALDLLFDGNWLTSFYLVLPLIALLALLTRRWVLAASMVTFAAALLALAQVHASLKFANPVGGAGEQWMAGSPSALLGAFGLVVMALVAISAEHAPKVPRKLLAVLLSVAALAPMGFLAATAPRDYQLKDDRVVPWLLSAQAAAHENLQMLVIEPTADGFAARWAPIAGIQLEDSNLVYRFALAKLNQNNEAYSNLASLVADLVSANGTSIAAALSSSHVAFVLVPTSTSAASNDLGNALDSVAELDSAGVTEFGRLWRVNQPVEAAPAAAKSPWSITKIVQLSVLLAFVLLAIPTSSRRRAKVSEIFIESDGDAA